MAARPHRRGRAKTVGRPWGHMARADWELRTVPPMRPGRGSPTPPVEGPATSMGNAAVPAAAA
eukprot:5035969-Alexandrium_andersonii.AAC.1